MDLLPAHVQLDDVDHDLGRFLFLRAALSRGHDHLVRRELKRAVPLTALPARARNVRTVDLDASSHHLVAYVDDVVVHVRSWKTSAWVSASSHDPALALAVVEEIRARVPRIT